MCNATILLPARCLMTAAIAAACFGVADSAAAARLAAPADATSQAVAPAATPARATAQAPAPPASARDSLAVRIDSLAQRARELSALVHRHDSARAAAVPKLRTDTVRVGPFLVITRGTPPPGLVAALAAEWESYAVMVGDAAAHLGGIVISPDVAPGELAPADPSLRHYPIHAGGRRTDYAGSARRTITDILIGESPADVRAWFRGAGLAGRDAHQWAYRSLALSEDAVLRGCFAKDTRACVAVLSNPAEHDTPASVLASGLLHALERGGAGSYSRLIADAPDIRARLERAAGAPISDLAADWRRVVQAERPRVHAGVARAGFWTLVWLCALGILATRSTRWRLG